MIPEPSQQIIQPALPGFYDLMFTDGEVEDANRHSFGDLISEIGLMRVFIRRALKKAQDIEDLDKNLRVVNALGLAASRLARLIEAQHKLSHGSSMTSQAISLAIEQIGKELRIE